MKKEIILDTSKIARYVWNGRGDVNWYPDCQQLFADLFGEDNLQLTSRLFAATSINTSLASNVTLFRKALYEILHDKPVGKYLPNIRTQIEHVRAGEPLSGRKINNFANAMSGVTTAVVCDIWIIRSFGISKTKFRPNMQRYYTNSPTDPQYDVMEKYIQQEAPLMGLEPRQMCSMIWSGIRGEWTGKSETHYKQRLYNKLHNLFDCI